MSMQAVGAPKLWMHRPDFAAALRALVFVAGLRCCGGCR